MSSTKASIRLVTETQLEFASMPETKMRHCQTTEEEERHAVRVSVRGLRRRHKRLGSHPEIQLSPEGLARADALGRTLPLQGSRLL